MEGKQVGRLKGAPIILSIVFVLLIIGYITDHPSVRDNMRIREFQRWIPQITTFFEQHREDFDTLRTGEFSANHAVVFRVGLGDDARLRLTYGEEGRIEVEQDDWHTIEWLPDEEKDAIFSVMDTMLGADWSRFSSIGAERAALRSTGGGGYSEGIFIFYPGVEPRRFGDGWVPPNVEDRTYTVALGHGYHLLMHVSRGPGGMGAAFGMIFRMIHMSLIVIFAVILILLYFKWYALRTKKSGK